MTKKKSNIIVYIIILFSLFFISLQIWLNRFFGVVDYEQFIIFLSFGIKGLLDSDDYIINKFLQICIYLPLGITFIIYLIFKYTNFINLKFTTNNFFSKLENKKISLSIFFLIISFFLFLKNISFENYFLNKNKEDFILKNYAEPKLEDFLYNNSTKNLVVIYVESLENLFLHEDFLREDLIKKLSFNEYNGSSFKSFLPTKYTNWTIGSIIATQCGIPQKPLGILDTQNIKIHENKPNKFIFGVKNFLPNVNCLGDLLKESKYKNIFINAVDLNFQAMGAFFSQHGYDEVIGKKYFSESNYKYRSKTWGGGPNDSILFEFAKDRISELIRNKKKFNVTILTTDTHDPGYLDAKCKISNKKDYNNFAKALNCTTESIYNFVKFINENFSEDIVVVILGDHIYPNELNIEEKFLNNKRTIYNSIISKDYSIHRDLVSHYDFFPTILNLVGFNFENNKLGLGYSAVKKMDQIKYKNYFEDLENNIQNKSDHYVTFWK